MNKDKLNKFKQKYAVALGAARVNFPDQYAWPQGQLDVVVDRMMTAVEKGSFNKDGHAFKSTCRELNIPHTYKAIRAFLE